MPSDEDAAYTIWELSVSDFISITIVSSKYGIFASFTISMNLHAYSGPVNSSLKTCSPKPLCMHWFKIPPSSISRSRIKMLSEGIPCSCADIAAARPAGPPPIIAISTFIFLIEYLLAFIIFCHSQHSTKHTTLHLTLLFDRSCSLDFLLKFQSF